MNAIDCMSIPLVNSYIDDNTHYNYTMTRFMLAMGLFIMFKGYTDVCSHCVLYSIA